MGKIKLSDWCEKNSISYITGYRWFKAGKLPAHAYQTETGTILVDDDEVETSEQLMKEENNNEAISNFLKKTVEFSNAKGSVEDFAAYVLSNYKLEMHAGSFEKTAKLKSKPTQEMTSSHFKQFLPKTPKPQPNMALMDQASLEQITSGDLDPNLAEKLKKANIIEQPVNFALMSTPEVNSIATAMQAQLVAPVINGQNYNPGVFSRADLQTNGSVVSSTITANSISLNDSSNSINACYLSGSGMPTQNDVDTWKQVFEEVKLDKDFKIFVHEGVNLNHTIIKYDQAKELTNRMLQANLLKTNDPIIIDQQAKEICKWTQEQFDYMDQLVNEISNKSVAKNNKKSRKKETK